MAYIKTTWVNEETALCADNMNNIENGIESLDLNAVKDTNYVHTDNNYTTAEKTKVSNAVVDANYVHTDNNYTAAEKTKLAGIEAGANNYVLPTANATTKGGVQPVAKSDAMTSDVGIDSNGKLYCAPADETIIKEAVDEYLEEHPVQVTTDTTLTQAGVPAEAKAAGDRISSLEFHNTAVEKKIGLSGLAKTTPTSYTVEGYTGVRLTKMSNVYTIIGFNGTYRVAQPIHLNANATIVIKNLGGVNGDILVGERKLNAGTEVFTPITMQSGSGTTAEWTYTTSTEVDFVYSYSEGTDSSYYVYDNDSIEEIENQRIKDLINDSTDTYTITSYGQTVNRILCKDQYYRVITSGRATLIPTYDRGYGLLNSVISVNGDSWIVPQQDCRWLGTGAYTGSLTIQHYTKESFDELYHPTKLPIGHVVQKSIASATGSLSDDNAQYRASTEHIILIPDCKKDLFIKAPNGVYCYMRYGYNTTAMKSDIKDQNNVGNMLNGSVAKVTNQSNIQMMRISFAYDASFSTFSKEIDAATVNSWIDNGELEIYYFGDDNSDVVKRNADKLNLVRGAMGAVRNTAGTSISGSQIYGNFTMLHLSDFHGDMKALDNVFKYAKAIRADRVAMTGDYCIECLDDGISFLKDVSDKYSTKVALCTGNHDTTQNAKRTTPYGQVTDETLYNAVFKPFVDSGKITNMTANTTYYYEDITWKDEYAAAYYYRLISLNTFDAHDDWTSTFISQTLMDWFISTLASTPANYGVIVLMHNLESTPTAIEGATNFYQTERRNTIKGISGAPLRQIVDAWQSRTTINTSVTIASTVINLVGDFTSVPASAEFICFMSGHEHYDLIGTNPGATNKLVVMNICCGSGAVIGNGYTGLAGSGDLSRRGTDVTQDAFNVVSIDRRTKKIKVVRIGATMNTNMVLRDYCSFSYKNEQ